MKDLVRHILDRVKETADFGYVAFDDVNDTNALGENALHCVCWWGDVDAARVLVEAGIDVNRPGEFGATPLAVAERRGFLELAEFLRSNGAVSVQPNFDDPSYREGRQLHLAKLSESIEQLNERIRRECGDDDSDSP